MRSRGGLVIRYNDVVGADHYRLHDLLGGFNNGKIDGGMNMDADVYGNYLAFHKMTAWKWMVDSVMSGFIITVLSRRGLESVQL